MGMAKAKLKQLRGMRLEADGRVLDNERMKQEGRRLLQEGRAEEAALKSAPRHGRHAR
ncbi:hypothetical protein ABZ208_22485 [Streptomyces sp. NPDC006208]|uniref:hypothetical protein n=1 Tax=Streptomyces sp. NPDC006208 TaxID=3156734 RepID=UPI0033B8415E